MAQIQVRRGTTAAWAAVDPVLAAGEPGVALPNGPMKIGDGVRKWSQLPMSSGGIDKATADASYAPKVTDAVLTRDSAGRITSAVENGVTVTYTRDAQGRIESETKSGKKTTYTRDSSGRVASWETVNA